MREVGAGEELGEDGHEGSRREHDLRREGLQGIILPFLLILQGTTLQLQGITRLSFQHYKG